MRVLITQPFADSLIKAPPEVQRLFGKQLANLLRDLRHPSLRAKRYDKERWQARVNDDWRFYFRIPFKKLSKSQRPLVTIKPPRSGIYAARF